MKNMQKASDFFEKARQGDTAAQKQLGILLIRENNTFDDGVAWLKKAANNDADAMYLLGRIYLRKQNDTAQSFYWYEKAAQNNHIDAMVDVGAFYVFGCYVERNISKAIEWYKKAASLKSPTAIHNLGFICYQDSELHGTAMNLFTKAANLGYADSAYMLGIMYLQGQGGEKNPQKALDNFMLADKLGKHFTCRAIGDLYIQGAFDNGKQNFEKAREWYYRGTEHGVLSCIEVLGDCYYYGFGVDVDFGLAYDFYKTAANMGSTDAAFLLGSMYIHGEFVKKNYNEALKWMLIAEKKGHEKAPRFVEMLFDILGDNDVAVASTAAGGSSGINLRSSYSATAEAAIAEQKARYEANKKKNASIYAAAGAMSGDGSYTDYEMGAVISADGEVSYVDTDLGVIFGADGSVSSHDVNTGRTYNWSTGRMMEYDETFNATMDFNSGKVSYNYNGFTVQ